YHGSVGRRRVTSSRRYRRRRRRERLTRACPVTVGVDPSPTDSIRTRAVPRPTMPSAVAAARDTSSTRPCANGPRSLTRTTTERPLARFVTRTWVPMGNERDAAVSACGSNRSPLAVRLPWHSAPYHDAIPASTGFETPTRLPPSRFGPTAPVGRLTRESPRGRGGLHP